MTMTADARKLGFALNRIVRQVVKGEGELHGAVDEFAKAWDTFVDGLVDRLLDDDKDSPEDEPEAKWSEAFVRRDPVLVGTLCRLIPLDVRGDHAEKFRVEVGDQGKAIGTVLRSHPDTDFQGWYFMHGNGSPTLIGNYSTVENAALQVAAAHIAFVRAVE